MEEDTIVRRRILLVEDESLVRESIGRLLSRDEHAVVEANNGVEAFSLFIRGQFDLVMTDFEIPFMKGNELAARIKQLAPRQPILMITGYGKKSGPDNPVDAVLNKPVDLDQLREAMACAWRIHNSGFVMEDIGVPSSSLEEVDFREDTTTLPPTCP